METVLGTPPRENEIARVAPARAPSPAGGGNGRRRTIARAALRIVAGWLLATVAAEGAFRALGDRPSPDLAGLYEPFLAGAYRLRPAIDTAGDSSAGRMAVHTDALGLRCDAQRHFGVAAGSQVDVLLLGDSQGFGNGLNFEQTLAGTVAQAAGREGQRVANASVGGHSAATQLALARWLHDTAPLHASMYVLLATPAIVQGGDHFTHARVGADGRLYGGAEGRLATARRWAKTHLALYGRFRDATHQLGLGVETGGEAAFVFRFFETGAAESRLQASFTRFVRQLRQFAAEDHASVAVVYVPLTFETEFAPIRRAAAQAGIPTDRDVPRRAAEIAARANRVSFFDLTPVLAAAHAAGAPLHLPGDFHYDAPLSRAAGEALWAHLRDVAGLASSHDNARPNDRPAAPLHPRTVSHQRRGS